MARQDILLDDDNNWKVENGDFVVGLSDEQHVGLLMVSAKGSYREAPAIGVDLTKWIGKQNNNISGLEREIMVQLEADGYKVTELKIDEQGEFILNYETKY